jgi:hypothetical protein
MPSQQCMPRQPIQRSMTRQSIQSTLQGCMCTQTSQTNSTTHHGPAQQQGSSVAMSCKSVLQATTTPNTTCQHNYQQMAAQRHTVCLHNGAKRPGASTGGTLHQPCTSKPCGKFMLLHTCAHSWLAGKHGIHSTSIKHASVQQNPCVLTTPPLTHPTCARALSVDTPVSCTAAKARAGGVLMHQNGTCTHNQNHITHRTKASEHSHTSRSTPHTPAPSAHKTHALSCTQALHAQCASAPFLPAHKRCMHSVHLTY